MIIGKAILKINPNAKYKYINEDINSIEWLEGTTPISIADIQAQISTVEQEIANEAQAKETAKASERIPGIASLPFFSSFPSARAMDSISAT